MKRLFLLLLVGLLVFVPGVASADDGPTERDITDLLLRIGGPVHVGPADDVKTVMVFDDDAVIDGTVAEQLVVVNGTATVTGTVKGSILVVNGNLVLRDGASIGHDVNLFRSNLTREGDVHIGGALHERADFGLGWAFFWRFRVGMTLVVLAAGLLFAAVGGRQLAGAAGYIGHQPAGTVAAAIIGAVMLPVVALIGIATVVGIPLGIAVFLFVMPALWFAGYLVAGTALGGMLLRMLGRNTETDHPYLAAMSGLLLFQAVGLVPVIGGLTVFVAAALGAGALVYRSLNEWRGTSVARIGTAVPAPM